MTDKAKNITEKLKSVLEADSNVDFAVTFGSILNKEKFRDIDVAVYFVKPPEGFELLEYMVKLDKSVGVEVDLNVLNSAGAFLRHQVFKTGEPLFIRDFIKYADFRDRTIADYQEYKYIAGFE
ncbi:MAG: nucleotidyltransferase domain-containing protein [Bacteroidetes bacterium]|nr:nucleotidyltransferase domain-containing protein [Bacteroidota bacterium]